LERLLEGFRDPAQEARGVGAIDEWLQSIFLCSSIAINKVLNNRMAERKK